MRDWLPVNARRMEPRVRNKIEPAVRSCVEEADPKAVKAAHRMLRLSFGVFEWALAELGTINAETVYHPDNVTQYVSEVIAQLSVAQEREALWTLEQIGRVVAPRFWPRERTNRPRTGPALPYSLKDEEAFRLAATLKNASVRAASAAVVSLSLGAGLSAIHIQRATPGDVVEMGQGRLAVWVDPESPSARLVPIRAGYTDLLNRAVEHSNGQRFVAGTSRNAVFALAKLIEVHGFGHFYLTRARSTWLQAHLLAGSPLAALRVIAGPVSLHTLDRLLGPASQTISAEDAALEGLGA